MPKEKDSNEKSLVRHSDWYSHLVEEIKAIRIET
jgi:hypothetical protein